MKSTLLSLLFAATTVLSSLAQSQSNTLSARELIEKINRRETIAYSNVTITGDVDLTELANKHKTRNGNWGTTDQYESLVEVPISFDHCRFTGRFIACKHDETLGANGTNFTASFQEPVTFTGCTFEGDAAFKYTVFKQQAIFTRSRFNGEMSNFKYSKFLAASDFAFTQFKGYADFKYTRFDESSTFQRVMFSQYADFKYTKFGEQTDFQESRFVSIADFRYTHFPRGTRFDNARFDGNAEFKYATLDGQQFSPRRQ
ncbi:hypothetical protein GCM10027578_43420 [Spirosoma luteolum]